jgi:DNA-binding CsgD family transcriptional regulator
VCPAHTERAREPRGLDDNTTTMNHRLLRTFLYWTTVLQLLAQGRSNHAIADELIVSIGTVKRHVHSIFGKLGVESRLQAVTRAHELHLV